MTSLSNADPTTAWAHRTWTDFAAASEREPLAILPVHGFADHGLGLPLDVEEVVGSEILHQAALLAQSGTGCLVLPPLRFGLAPYDAALFGIDPETAHDLMLEMAAGIQAAGARKLVFFVTSPWQEEFIESASRDVRGSLGLQTFVITLAGLGLDFHPASSSRAHLQAMGAHLLGVFPEPARPGRVLDPAFRPGRWDQPPPVVPVSGLDPEALYSAAAVRLTRLLLEIVARAPLGSTAHGPVPALPSQPAPRATEMGRVWPRHRPRYLPALSRDGIDQLPDRERCLVILPTAAIEQHGHHLPVGVDAFLGQAFLDRALAQLPLDAAVWVAPPITYGKSNEHVGFPGTITISARSFRRLLHAQVRQLHQLGFRQFAVLNTHGGNSAVLVYTLREIQAQLGVRAGMISNPYRPQLSEQEARYGFHAGEWETSLMLAAAPGTVRLDRAVCEYPAHIQDPGELRPEDAPAIFSWITRDISRTGVMGDATAATREKGERWLAEASAALAGRILELLGNPAP